MEAGGGASGDRLVGGRYQGRAGPATTDSGSDKAMGESNKRRRPASAAIISFATILTHGRSDFPTRPFHLTSPPAPYLDGPSSEGVRAPPLRASQKCGSSIPLRARTHARTPACTPSAHACWPAGLLPARRPMPSRPLRHAQPANAALLRQCTACWACTSTAHGAHPRGHS